METALIVGLFAAFLLTNVLIMAYYASVISKLFDELRAKEERTQPEPDKARQIEQERAQRLWDEGVNNLLNYDIARKKSGDKE